MSTYKIMEVLKKKKFLLAFATIGLVGALAMYQFSGFTGLIFAKESSIWKIQFLKLTYNDFNKKEGVWIINYDFDENSLLAYDFNYNESRKLNIAALLLNYSYEGILNKVLEIEMSTFPVYGSFERTITLAITYPSEKCNRPTIEKVIREIYGKNITLEYKGKKLCVYRLTVCSSDTSICLLRTHIKPNKEYKSGQFILFIVLPEGPEKSYIWKVNAQFK